MTFTSTSTQGSAAITTYVWASNGTPICSNSSTCTAPFGTPSNTITLTVTGQQQQHVDSHRAGEHYAPDGTDGALQHERRRAERERRADPDLQPAGERQREHDLHQHQHAGERGHHHLRLEEQRHPDLQQLVDLHGPFGTPSNTVTLTVTDSNSLTSTATGQVNITHPTGPTAHFSMSGGGQSGATGRP